MKMFTQLAAAAAMALMLAFGFGAAAHAAGVSKASYAADAQSPLLQLVSNKPCCYSYRTGTYQRFSAKTCYRVEGRIVDDRFCGGHRWDNDRWNDRPFIPPHHLPRPYRHVNPQYQQQGLCCKRGRKEWWVNSAHDCAYGYRGQLVHPSYCYKY